MRSMQAENHTRVQSPTSGRADGFPLLLLYCIVRDGIERKGNQKRPGPRPRHLQAKSTVLWLTEHVIFFCILQPASLSLTPSVSACAPRHARKTQQQHAACPFSAPSSRINNQHDAMLGRVVSTPTLTARLSASPAPRTPDLTETETETERDRHANKEQSPARSHSATSC